MATQGTPFVVTYARLEALRVSPAQLDLFMTTFGDVAEVTEENVLKALEAGLDVSWLLYAVLHDERLDEFYDALRAQPAIEPGALATLFVRLYTEEMEAQQGA